LVYRENSGIDQPSATFSDDPLDDCNYRDSVHVDDLACGLVSIEIKNDSIYISLAKEIHSGGICLVADNEFKSVGPDYSYPTYSMWVFHVDELEGNYFITKKTKFFYDGETICGSLPIEVLYFKASKDGEHCNLIELETSSEKDSDIIRLKASRDGKNFEVIHDWKSKNEPSYYQFRHCIN